MRVCVCVCVRACGVCVRGCVSRYCFLCSCIMLLNKKKPIFSLLHQSILVAFIEIMITEWRREMLRLGKVYLERV